jgi:hypothetical protein
MSVRNHDARAQTSKTAAEQGKIVVNCLPDIDCINMRNALPASSVYYNRGATDISVHSIVPGNLMLQRRSVDGKVGQKTVSGSHTNLRVVATFNGDGLPNLGLDVFKRYAALRAYAIQKQYRFAGVATGGGWNAATGHRDPMFVAQRAGTRSIVNHGPAYIHFGDLLVFYAPDADNTGVVNWNRQRYDIPVMPYSNVSNRFSPNYQPGGVLHSMAVARDIIGAQLEHDADPARGIDPLDMDTIAKYGLNRSVSVASAVQRWIAQVAVATLVHYGYTRRSVKDIADELGVTTPGNDTAGLPELRALCGRVLGLGPQNNANPNLAFPAGEGPFDANGNVRRSEAAGRYYEAQQSALEELNDAVIESWRDIEERIVGTALSDGKPGGDVTLDISTRN